MDSLLSKLSISPQALVEYVPAAADDETVSEAVTIESLGEKDGQTVVYLTDSLKNVYDRATVSSLPIASGDARGNEKEILAAVMPRRASRNLS